MNYSGDFNFDLEFGEKAETWVHQIFSEGGKIEVKYDRLAHKTGNIYVEVYSRNKPSGISTSKANYWIFIIDKKSYGILINIKRLKDICKEVYYKNGYTQGGDEDTSLGVLIPIKLII
jgi:hypothetical protein